MRLAYELAGDGEPVTALHGFSQGGPVWREQVALLPAWSWLMVDLRGHGRTLVEPGGAHTLEACAADLDRAWDRLGISRTHLVGYSMGGRLALHVASTRPARLLSLVTLGAHAGLEGEEREGRRREDEQLAARIERDGIEWFADHWDSLPLFAGLTRRGPGFRAQLRGLRLRNRPEGLAASLRGMGAGAVEPFWDRLGDIDCPALFLAGERDGKYAERARRLRAAVRGSEVALVPRAGHAAHLEMPLAFAGILRAHLSRR